ncbi:hypothetical protein [Ruegeria arenilitoris]|uniref:hypothetical protein n=1 Tax=Ruegeria arenilitoris TaxID=1173585 RepID=UPI001479C5AF|nr:hypothetical protein [Ruegeria arenilitoris]
MLKLKVGVADAVATYTDVMRESVLLAFGMCFIFYFFGMLALVMLGHYGAKANRLLGMTPERE